jgi:hypothetical protein
MIEKNKFLTFGLVLVAVLVILEAISLIDVLPGKEKLAPTVDGDKKVEITTVVKSDPIQTPVTNPDLSMILSADKTALKVGQSTMINVNLVDKLTHNIDGVDLYIKYDPAAFAVSNMSFSDRLSKPDVAINSVKKGLVVVNYFISTPVEGFKIDNQQLKLVSFNVKALKEGDYTFEVNTSQQNKESVSIVAEHATGKVTPRSLPFSSSPLTINVLK